MVMLSEIPHATATRNRADRVRRLNMFTGACALNRSARCCRREVARTHAPGARRRNEVTQAPQAVLTGPEVHRGRRRNKSHWGTRHSSSRIFQRDFLFDSVYFVSTHTVIYFDQFIPSFMFLHENCMCWQSLGVHQKNWRIGFMSSETILNTTRPFL